MTTKTKECKAFLSPNKCGAVVGGHPWVFSKMIESIHGDPGDGEHISVWTAREQRFIAHGLFDSKSDIRVRLYSWNQQESVDETWFRKRISSAISLRKTVLGFAADEAQRLICGEGDGLSGLTVDRYAQYLVLQVTSVGIAQRIEMVSRILRDLCDPKGILLRGTGDKQREGLFSESKILAGAVPREPIVIQEHGLFFHVNVWEGQKTGCYLDQKDNRYAVAKLARGRRVLDLFCYTGGFGLHCAKAGAREVVGVDRSDIALAAARHHAHINTLPCIRFESCDALEYLLQERSESYDLIVLDPPRLVPTANAKKKALTMYYRLNAEALRLLAPEGILVSCSCCGRIGSGEWLSLLASVARRSHKPFAVLEERGAGADHPFLLSCPESRYLKCVVGRIPAD